MVLLHSDAEALWKCNSRMPPSLLRVNRLSHITAACTSKAFTDIKGYECLEEAVTMPAFWTCLNAVMVMFYPLYCLL